MKTEIILLIIAFQVVMSIMAKRKAAKKAAEAARTAPQTQTGPRAQRDPASLPASHGGQDAPRARTAIPGRSSYDEDDADDEEEWEEHHMRGQSRPAPAAPAPNPGRAAEMGKDLLSQLAKELGLEIPQRNPASQPRPAAPQPPARPQPAPKPAARSERTQAASRIPQPSALARAEAAQRAAQALSARPASRDGGENSPRRPLSNLPVTAAPEAPSSSSLAQASLMDAESIRRAFILKTILDKPLSLRPRRPGGD